MGLPPTHKDESQAFVTPAQAGVHVDRTNWIPAFAGMTRLSTERSGANPPRRVALASSAEKQQGDPAVEGPQGGIRGTEQGRPASTRAFLAIFFALI
jgi:hypothetical protein